MPELIESSRLPWTCPEHPGAQIKHTWLRTRCVARLTAASWEYNEPGSHRYECAECGRQLAPPKEATDA